MPNIVTPSTRYCLPFIRANDSIDPPYAWDLVGSGDLLVAALKNARSLVMREWAFGFYIVDENTLLNHWTLTLVKLTNAGAEVEMASFSTYPGYTANANVAYSTVSFSASGALATSDKWMTMRAVPVGEPGGLYYYGNTLWVSDV